MDDILIIESTVSHDSLEDDAYDVIKHVKPEWSRTDVQFKVIIKIVLIYTARIGPKSPFTPAATIITVVKFSNYI
jgi:hypothetical protein